MQAFGFAGGGVGYASTKGGGTWRTTDGGDTWTEETSVDRAYGGPGSGDVVAFDADRALIAGVSGCRSGGWSADDRRLPAMRRGRAQPEAAGFDVRWRRRFVRRSSHSAPTLAIHVMASLNGAGVSR